MCDMCDWRFGDLEIWRIKCVCVCVWGGGSVLFVRLLLSTRIIYSTFLRRSHEKISFQTPTIHVHITHHTQIKRTSKSKSKSKFESNRIESSIAAAVSVYYITSLFIITGIHRDCLLYITSPLIYFKHKHGIVIAIGRLQYSFRSE